MHGGNASPLASSHLFGPLQLVVHRLFGNLHLDDLLPEQLVLILSSAAFVLHALQLVVQTHRHIFGYLRSQGQTYEPLTDAHNTPFIYKYTPTIQTCRHARVRPIYQLKTKLDIHNHSHTQLIRLQHKNSLVLKD